MVSIKIDSTEETSTIYRNELIATKIKEEITMNDTPKPRMIYSTKDVKEILHTGNSMLQQMLNSETNPIPHFRIGRRIVIPCDLFHQWLDRQPESYMSREER